MPLSLDGSNARSARRCYLEGVGGSVGCWATPPTAKRLRTVLQKGGQRWLRTAARFVLNLKVPRDKKDFRQVRCLRICHLVDLVDASDSSCVSADLKRLRAQAAGDVAPYAVAEPL